MLQQPELLAPAGSLETLKYAVMYGADAVYCALPEFGMRAAPVNLTVGELHEGCIFAHARGKKVYLTLNTLPTNEELSKLPQYIQDAAEAGVDAFIIADLGVLALAKKYAPQVERHVSTQAGITNYEAAKVCYELGAKRVVLARELPLTEIALIRDNCPADLELEAFVHGAMCMSVSGRCLLSSYMAGRSGNRGECAQPCRWKYDLVEEHRPGQYMEIGESEGNGSYILNANDLCTAPFIDLICKAGVDSLKIEGRAKTFYYVASVTSAYRRALDAYLKDPYNDNFELPDDVIEELNRTSHRHYSPGFYFGKEQAQQTPSHTYVRDWDFIGTVDGWDKGVARCTQRGKFSIGDTIEILQPDGSVVTLTPEWIENAEGERVVNEKDSNHHILEVEQQQTNSMLFLLMDAENWDAWYAKLPGTGFNMKAVEGYLEANGSSTPIFAHADTLEELAGLVGMDPAVLTQTVEDYNAGVEAGQDEFGRTGDNLKMKIGEGPYYLVEQKPRYATTMGGLVVNGSLEVQNNAGESIQGLFACGEVVGAVMGSNSPSGANNGWALTSGKLAADTICA